MAALDEEEGIVGPPVGKRVFAEPFWEFFDYFLAQILVFLHQSSMEQEKESET